MAEPQLTPTEHAILDAIREGRVDAEIAARLGISIAEVKRRVEHLQSIAGADQRSALADWDPGQARVSSPPGASSYAALPSHEQSATAGSAEGTPPAAGGDTGSGSAGPLQDPPGDGDGARISRRGLLLGALGVAAAGATGSYFLLRGGGNAPASDGRRFVPSDPTATPESTPSPTSTPVPDPAAITRDSGTWVRESIRAGQPVPGSHGIGFMDTRTAEIDFLGLAPAERSLGQGYMASPGNRFVSAWGEVPIGGSGPHAGIFDRRTGASWAVPYDQFYVQHLEDDLVVLRAVAAASGKDRELGNLFFVLDEDMREVSRFTANGGSGPVQFQFDGQKQLFMIEGATVTAIDVATGAKTRLVSPQEITGALGSGAASGVVIAEPQVVAGELYVDAWASSEGQRYLGSVPGLKGHSIEVPDRSGRSLFEASPDGRYFLYSGTYRANYSGAGANEDWVYADVVTLDGANPVLRARSALLTYGDALPNRRWLADSSGFVAEVQDPDAPVDTTSEWRVEGRRFAIIRLDGSVEHLPRFIREARLGSFFGSSPIPSPDNRDLFSLGRSAVFNRATGEILAARLPQERPAHLDPWGNTSDEMRFAFPHGSHSYTGTGTVLPLDIQQPPFDDEVALVTARAGTCVNVRAEPSVGSESLGCLPDGVRCTLDPAMLLPETARRAGSDEAIAFHWEDEQAFVHVRTEYGHRGWIAMQFLDWA